MPFWLKQGRKSQEGGKRRQEAITGPRLACNAKNKKMEMRFGWEFCRDTGVGPSWAGDDGENEAGFEWNKVWNRGIVSEWSTKSGWTRGRASGWCCPNECVGVLNEDAYERRAVKSWSRHRMSRSKVMYERGLGRTVSEASIYQSSILIAHLINIPVLSTGNSTEMGF